MTYENSPFFNKTFLKYLFCLFVFTHEGVNIHSTFVESLFRDNAKSSAPLSAVSSSASSLPVDQKQLPHENSYGDASSQPSSSSSASSASSPSSEANISTLLQSSSAVLDLCVVELIFDKLLNMMKSEIQSRKNLQLPASLPTPQSSAAVTPPVIGSQTVAKSPVPKSSTRSPSDRKRKAPASASSPSPASKRKLSLGAPPSAVSDYTRCFLLAFLETQFIEDIFPTQELWSVIKKLRDIASLNDEDKKISLETCPLLFRFIVSDDYLNHRYVYRLLFFFIDRAIGMAKLGMSVLISCFIKRIN